MDQSSLKNSDVLILTGLTQMPTANPDGMLGEFCSNLGEFSFKEGDTFRLPVVEFSRQVSLLIAVQP